MAIKTFTTGEVLTSANTNTYLANSGLVYVKEQTVGSGVSTVTVTNAFSATYDSYLITLNRIVCSVDNTDLRLRLGLVASTTVAYNLQYMTIGSNVVSGSSGTAGAGLIVSFTENGTAGFTSVINVHNPFLTVLTRYQSDWGNNDFNGVYRGFDNTTTSYTDFMIIPASGTMTGGVITVYGYRKA